MFQPSSPQYDHSTIRMSSPIMPGHAPTYTGLGYAELTPGDSASVVHDDSRSTVSSHMNSSSTFSFKFNYGNKTHRFRHDGINFENLLQVIQQKIMVEHLSISQSYVAVGKEDGEDWLTIAYLDDENDQVLMTCDSDLADSVQLARKSGLDRVRLFVHDSLADAVAEQQQLKQQQKEEEQLKLQQRQQELANSVSAMADMPASQPTTLGYMMEGKESLSDIKEDDEEEEEEEEEIKMETVTKKKRSHSLGAANVKRDISAVYNLPIPQDMLLPAAITFLGVVILGVFTISKLTSNSSARY